MKNGCQRKEWIRWMEMRKGVAECGAWLLQRLYMGKAVAWAVGQGLGTRTCLLWRQAIGTRLVGVVQQS